jgi:hypothetical protein
LTVTFTLSALRIIAPSARLWLPLTVGCAVVMFIIGYLSPGPDGDDEDDEDEDVDEADENDDADDEFADDADDEHGADDEHHELDPVPTGEPSIAPTGRPVTQGGLSNPPVPPTSP